jgi:anthranilate phosphoribosyltransferase
MACAGPFVYPKELRLLARGILPFGMKAVGRFFNLIGPFLAAIPVTAQITGTSDQSVLPTFKGLTAEESTKRYWLVWNDLGADELLSIVDSHVYDSRRDEESVLSPTELGLSGGSFDELRPVENIDDTVDHFLALLGGEGPTAAIESIKLNAGALAINCEVAQDWPQAFRMAADAMAAGEPARLIERMRAHGEKKPAAGVAPQAGSRP